jgi:phosphoribosyl-ATP pyrophosphohydrolase
VSGTQRSQVRFQNPLLAAWDVGQVTCGLWATIPSGVSAEMLAASQPDYDFVRKIIEEAFELCLELGRAGRDDFAPARVAEEAADVVFHVLAGLVAAGVPLEDVLDELWVRRGGRR